MPVQFFSYVLPELADHFGLDSDGPDNAPVLMSDRPVRWPRRWTEDADQVGQAGRVTAPGRTWYDDIVHFCRFVMESYDPSDEPWRREFYLYDDQEHAYSYHWQGESGNWYSHDEWYRPGYDGHMRAVASR